MRVAVVDIGSNSTRLLIANVEESAATIEELVRRSTVTRLGQGVDASGSLSEDGIARVLDTLASYRREIDERRPPPGLAALPSAGRDPPHGPPVAPRLPRPAGTATSAAAIDQRLDPYDPARVHGYRLGLGAVETLLSRLAAMSERERRGVRGLHPDRAPTIVAGMILLREAMRVFAVAQVEVSE